jgi:hypothetical protein
MLHGPCTGRYVWERRAFPWLVTWEENYSRAGLSARWSIIVATYINRYSLRRTLQRTARRGPEWPMRSHALPAHVLRSALQHSTLRRNTVPQRCNTVPQRCNAAHCVATQYHSVATQYRSVATQHHALQQGAAQGPRRGTHPRCAARTPYRPASRGLPSALAAVWLVSCCAFVDADGVRRAVRPYAVMYPYITWTSGRPSGAASQCESLSSDLSGSDRSWAVVHGPLP